MRIILPREVSARITAPVLSYVKEGVRNQRLLIIQWVRIMGEFWPNPPNNVMSQVLASRVYMSESVPANWSHVFVIAHRAGFTKIGYCHIWTSFISPSFTATMNKTNTRQKYSKCFQKYYLNIVAFCIIAILLNVRNKIFDTEKGVRRKEHKECPWEA